MARGEGWTARRARWLNRVAARSAGRARVGDAALTLRTDPHLIGSLAAGRQLVSGNFLFAGYLVEAPGTSPWDLPQPSRGFAAGLHGFGWLDDLAALGDAGARRRARDWTADWIARFAGGTGPGWTPDLAGRRLLRLINHADLVGAAAQAPALARHTLFLARRWHAATPGLPRIEALTGLLHGALTLTGSGGRARVAHRALARECGLRIDADGGIPSRNPEELLEVFSLLVWSSALLTQAGRQPGVALTSAIERVAPTLRALRHADGALARFHGGGRGAEGRLDEALAQAGLRGRVPAETRAMGYSRLLHGRTSVVIDTAPPPRGPASAEAHASSLAFEVSSGRRPLIVSCGPGATFGESWRRAGRTTASHATLVIDDASSARFGPGRRADGSRAELVLDAPREIPAERDRTVGGTVITARHDGYAGSHGLVHVRRLELSHDGRALTGEDSLVAPEPAHRRRFDRVRDDAVPFAIRFHLHPGVRAAPEGDGVRLTLGSGEAWLFQLTRGRAALRLESSVYLAAEKLAPVTTWQVVLFSAAVEYSTRIGWSLAKTGDTPSVLRDVGPDDRY